MGRIKFVNVHIKVSDSLDYSSQRSMIYECKQRLLYASCKDEHIYSQKTSADL